MKKRLRLSLSLSAGKAINFGMRQIVALVCCWFLCCDIIAAASTNHVLKISPSSTKITGAKLTLSVGTMRRTNDLFAGEFQMKVSPFVFKNEKGLVTIELDDKAFAKAAAGESIEVKGTAKTNGKNGPKRPLTALATPKDSEKGSLAITIQDGNRKLRFLTDYKFLAE